MKAFSHDALLRQMRNAWASTQGVMFNVKGPNLFLVQCHDLGDWKRIMEGGPWIFVILLMSLSKSMMVLLM